ncbi:MAG: AP2 domain-containing protein [Peptococcaceae bacterium]|nr:AP2 domain-containing protein [Peptococcaceae bacterium]
MPKNNKSGIKGVSWGRKSGKWDANITFKKKRYSLGSYDDINDAAKARELAEEQLFRPFLEWHEAYIQSVLKGETPPKEPYIQLTKEYMSDRGRSS